ncbi:hypothetical protein ACI784_09145 [Geodermatophilus sp. SYSU D01186]
MSFCAAARRSMFTAAAALLCVGAFASAGSAAPAPDAGSCKKGGYANYIDPVTSKPFVDQGSCVAFVRHGGVLQGLPDLSALNVTFTAEPWAQAGMCNVVMEVSGLPTAGTTSTEWFVNGVSTGSGGAATGPVARYSIVVAEGDVVGLAIGGERRFESGPVICAPEPPPADAQPQITITDAPAQSLSGSFQLAGFQPNETVHVYVVYTQGRDFYGSGQFFDYGNLSLDSTGSSLVHATGGDFCAAFPLYVEAERADGSILRSALWTAPECVTTPPGA